MTDNKIPEKKFETPYPNYDVLSKWDSPSFNDQTRRVIAHRLNSKRPRRFFHEREFALLRAVMDTILPQDERSDEDRIAIEEFIDEKLYTDGTRHADILPQRKAWRQGLLAINAEAQAIFDHEFLELSATERYQVLENIDTGKVHTDQWNDLSPKRFFRHIVLKQAVKIYYAHPFAWNEIGFGGPAAPRGYVRLGPDMRDPWEAKEERRPQKAKQLP